MVEQADDDQHADADDRTRHGIAQRGDAQQPPGGAARLAAGHDQPADRDGHDQDAGEPTEQQGVAREGDDSVQPDTIRLYVCCQS